MGNIDNELKSNSLSRFHLIYGEEQYTVRFYKNKLIKALSSLGDDMNCSRFKGEKISVSEIVDIANVLPFMAPNRLIVVEDSGFFKSSSDFADFIEGFPETTYVVFVEQAADKRNRLYKFFQKNGCITECKFLPIPKVKDWAIAYISNAGKRIKRSAVEKLIEQVGSNLELLQNELEKVIAYTGDRKDIELEDVEKICSGMTVGKMFDMVDAVANGDQKSALKLYADMLETKEPPMVILHNLTRHINVMLMIKDLSNIGLSNMDIAQKAGIPAWTIPKYTGQASHFRKSSLIDMIKLRAEYEQQIKTGQIGDQIAVELFIIQALTKSQNDD